MNLEVRAIVVFVTLALLFSGRVGGVMAQQPAILVTNEDGTQLENLLQPIIGVAPLTATRFVISNAQSAAITSVAPPSGFGQQLPPRIQITSAQLADRVVFDARPPVPGGTDPQIRVKLHNAQGSQTTSLPVASLPAVIPVGVGSPQRVVIFVQGITSKSDCPTGQGFLDRAPLWLENYLQSDPLIKSEAEVVDFVYFSYNSGYCNNGNGQDGAVPDYQAIDTCFGDIEGAYTLGLKNLIQLATDKFPGSKVTLVSHSQGGFITSHLIGSLISDDPDFVKQRIASVITFDSFPKGVPGGPDGIGISALEAYYWANGCSSPPDLSQWASGQPVAGAAGHAAMPFGSDRHQVTFYTLDAANGPILPQWTQIRGSQHHELIPNSDHGDIWANATQRKQQLVGCAVILAHTCNLSQSASLLMPGQTQTVSAVIPSGSLRAIFTISWPSSKVNLTPVAPDGVRMDSSNLPFGSLHRVGADFETYELINPQSGDWELELFGEDVPASGEPVTVLIDFESPPNEPPLADAGTSYQVDEGAVVSFSALGSTDPDGQITQHEWDLNVDGQYEAFGVTTDLVVDDDGRFIVGLRVTDNASSTDTTTAEVIVNNVAPELTVSADQSVVQGVNAQIDLATFTDPSNLDTHTATIDWGDGSPIDAGNITISSAGTPGTVGGLSGLISGSHTYNGLGEFTTAVEVCDDDLDCTSDSLQVQVANSAAVLPAAELSLTPHQDPADGATGLKINIDLVFDPANDETDLPVLLESFEAQLTYDASCINILPDVRSTDFTISEINIDNTTGVTSFNGNSAGGITAPTALAQVLTRMVGNKQVSCDVALRITSLTNNDENSITVVPTIVSQTLLRGDARADGEVSIADALFIAQYLVGLREACTTVVNVSCLHSVNAASVRHDDAFDEKTIADTLFIAQNLVGIRDDSYLLPSPFVDIQLDADTSNVGIGEQFSVQVVLDAGPSRPVDGAQVYLDFDNSILEVQDIQNGTVLDLVLTSDFNNGLGQVDYVAGINPGNSNGPIDSPFTLMTIDFVTRAASGTGGTNIVFAPLLIPRLTKTVVGAGQTNTGQLIPINVMVE